MYKSIAALLLTAVPLTVSAFQIQLGPFSLQVGDGVHADRVSILDTPVCHAIRTHRQIEVILELNEKVNEQEFSSIIKKVVVEPYVLGIDSSGRPVLKGNIVKEDVLKEINVKYPQIKKGTEGVLSGYFNYTTSNGEKNTINIDQIRDVQVLQQTSVKVPDNLQDLAKDLQVLCIM